MAGKGRGNSAGEAAPHSPELDFGEAVGRWFLWLRLLTLGHRTIGDVKITGISIRFDYLSVMIVIRGLHLERVRNVVVFGSGETLYIALRNVTLAMDKCHWKDDKYHLLP